MLGEGGRGSGTGVMPLPMGEGLVTLGMGGAARYEGIWGWYPRASQR